jgi:chromosome segregation ATPase
MTTTPPTSPQGTEQPPLTDEELAAARQHDRAYAPDPDDAQILAEAAADRRALLAEVDRLRAELAEMSDHLDEVHDQRTMFAKQVDDVRARFREYIKTHRIDSSNVREERDKAQGERDALAAKLAAVHELVQEAVARMEPVSWVDALRAALGEDGGTE